MISATARLLLGLISAGLLFVPLPASANIEAGFFDELTPLYPDSSPAKGVSTFRLAAARGTQASVLVLAKADTAIHVTAESTTKGPLPELQTLRSVPVEENTGLTSRTERWDGKTNPHVIRRAPFDIYEVLSAPQPGLHHEKAGDPLAFRVTCDIPANATPGVHTVKILLQSAADRKELVFAIEIFPTVVPPSASSSLRYTNWFSNSNIARYQKVPLWSDAFWKQLERYASLMAHGRQNTFWVKGYDFFERQPDGSWRLQRERLVRYVDIFTRAGLVTIEGAPLAGRKGSDWSSPRLWLGRAGCEATSDAGKKHLVDLCRQLKIVIKEEGWGKRWIQHVSDEPTHTNANDYKLLSAFLRKQLPGIPIIEATMSTQLTGAVDIWTPQIQEFQKHRAFFDTRKAAGDRVWVYTCLTPGGPWLNRLLDQERLRPVYIGWALVHYELGGFLHWGLNHYRADPFKESVVPHGILGSNNRLPAGDTHVIYPGPDGPLSGLRFEAHRIGFEDAELLLQLKAQNPEAAAAIIKTLFRACDDYEKNVPAYRKVKRELLKQLSAE